MFNGLQAVKRGGEGAGQGRERGEYTYTVHNVTNIEAENTSPRGGDNKIIFITYNVDGGWDESARHRVWGLINSADTAGGCMLLQDVRLTRPECQARWRSWWSGRESVPGGVLEQASQGDLSRLKYSFAEPLIEPDVDQQKLMGGLLTITWGCLASRTRSDLQEADRWGRWVTTTLLGRGGRRIKVINAYRWPLTTQGGLVARECRLRG